MQGEDKKRVSTADLVLVGHEENAQFALGCSSARSLVASGGEDQQARARTHASALFRDTKQTNCACVPCCSAACALACGALLAKGHPS
jgi:hypothetical protein